MSEKPIELAMTHRVGMGGQIERCLRPQAVRDLAARVRKWPGSAESCHGCHSRSAMGIASGMPLCGPCRAERAIRSGLEPAGLAPRVVRAEESTGDAPQFRGLSIVFNRPSVDMGFIEYMRPSSVDRTFSEHIDVRALWSHNADITIGRQSAGTLRLRKTANGLAAEIDPPKWAAGYVESVKRRDVTGQSFAFETVSDWWWMEDGEARREILDARIFEVSGVSWPAYPDTTLEVVRADARSAWTREQETAERLRLVR